MTKSSISALMIAALFAASAAAAADDNITIGGTLTAGIAYRLQVDYKTTANRAECQFDDYITGMRVARNDMQYFEPVIQGRTHQLQASLQHADDGCGWTPKVISLCVGAGTAAQALHCQPLFILGQGDAPPARLDIHCNRSGWLCTTVDNSGRLRRDVTNAPAKLTLDISAGN